MINRAVGQCRPCGPRDVERKRFLYLWRHRFSSLRAMNAVTTILSDPATGRRARMWIAEEAAEAGEVRDRELVQLAALRASMGAVSLLLTRACQVESIPLAAVAHGVLPKVHFLGDCEGFPWLPDDEWPTPFDPELLVRKFPFNRFYSRFYWDSAIVRPQSHPQGGWGVRQQQGALLASMELGGCRVVSMRGGIGVIDLPTVYPETVLAALRDRPLVKVVEHAVFDDPRFVIRLAGRVGSVTRLKFSCPLEPIEFDALRPAPGQEHHQLGRDGRLTGDEALRDVLARRTGGRPSWYARRPDVSGGYPKLDDEARERLWRIDIMTPPWGTRLPQLG